MLKLFGLLGSVAFVLLAILGIAVLFAYPTMWVVNYLFSTTILSLVFGISKITVWKALVLNTFIGFFRSSSSTSSSS